MHCKLLEQHPDLRKFGYAFNTAGGNIHLDFLTAEEAEEVYQNWKPESWRQAGPTRRISLIEAHYRAVPIHGVPTNIKKTEIGQRLSSNYAGIKAISFVKQWVSTLPTINLIFPTTVQTEEALTAGAFPGSIFCRPIRFGQQGIKIKQCFKCQKFGHVKVNYKSKQSCRYCYEKHKFKDWPNKSKPQKRCHEEHPSKSGNCPIFINQSLTVYQQILQKNSREIHIKFNNSWLTPPLHRSIRVQSVIMQKLPSKDTSMKKTENSRIEQDQKNLRQQPLWIFFHWIFLSWPWGCDAHLKISFTLILCG